MCRDRGYLPADYLERPADHRQSILDLPLLSKAKIGALYDDFTALRAKLWSARGSDVGHVHDSAALG